MPSLIQTERVVPFIFSKPRTAFIVETSKLPRSCGPFQTSGLCFLRVEEWRSGGVEKWRRWHKTGLRRVHRLYEVIATLNVLPLPIKKKRIILIVFMHFIKKKFVFIHFFLINREINASSPRP